MNIVFKATEQQLADENVQKAIELLDRMLLTAKNGSIAHLEAQHRLESSEQCVVSSSMQEIKDATQKAITKNSANREEIVSILSQWKAGRVSDLKEEFWDEYLMKINSL